MTRRRLALLSLLIAFGFSTAAPAQEDAGFTAWLAQFKANAREQGIPQAVLDDALNGLAFDPNVIELDGRQPENKITLAQYVRNTVSKRRIAKGRAMMKEYHSLLRHIGVAYGVQPKYIVALWAIESDFGDHKGEFSVIQSLATLAYEGRRAEFFNNELIAALRILQAENLSSDQLTGSWAGAMGDCQFMPSTYLRYAVDGNGDGKRDIWNTESDVFSSIARYLQALGWNPHRGWGRAASRPEDFAAEEATIEQGHSLGYWQKRGLRDRDGKMMTGPKDAALYAIYATTPEDGLFLVTENFKALLQWNRSRYFAVAVGTLADAIGE